MEHRTQDETELLDRVDLAALLPVWRELMHMRTPPSINAIEDLPARLASEAAWGDAVGLGINQIESTLIDTPAADARAFMAKLAMAIENIEAAYGDVPPASSSDLHHQLLYSLAQDWRKGPPELLEMLGRT